MGPDKLKMSPGSLLSCMLIVRPTVQLFTCRTEGPDPVFGKGTRLCNPTAAVADSIVTKRKYLFSSLAPSPLESMSKDKLPCATCYLNLLWQFSGVWCPLWCVAVGVHVQLESSEQGL